MTSPGRLNGMPRETGRKVIAQNKRARHDFHIEDTFEAGIVLQGTEVKSLRAGRASLTDGYATIKDGEAWLINVHIPEYTLGTWTNHAARRTRKLLLHRKEIDKLLAKTKESGLTIIPLALYFKDGKAKIEIGLGRGKKDWDKRHALAEKQAKREMARATRHKHR
ncbi:SsrA-binding protein [Sinosporangium siamense]|uniref:SsrA-binding protein n=2 Tax=Sinosporangium siamense TaxID=1367973 RepID=A0A919V6K1_9ACTN|nr:SsrA-binding protein [Sinosporangium siamense]